MTIGELVLTTGREVWAVAELNGQDRWAAAQRVWDGLTKAEQRRVGIWALVTAERDALRHARPIHGEENGGHGRPGTHKAGAPFSRRREALRDLDPMDFGVAVANSGERKRAGDLTRADMLSMAAYYGTNKRAYEEKENGWRRLAHHTPEGKRLEDVKLGDKDMAFLLAELAG